MENKKVIEEQSVTDILTITTLMDYNEQRMFLKVDYMGGKFTTEKNFRNNYLGISEFESTKKYFMSEENVKSYFGL